MIDPLLTNTVRTGELPVSDFGLADKLAHEIGTDLFQGTVQQLADVISSYIGSLSGIAFNPTTVPDGGTLPATSTNEWMLVGKGTFNNVGGGATIICTEELNALTSNGTYWSLAVEIPINVELAGITQNIRSGYTETTPSEDALFTEFAKYTKTVDMPPDNTENRIPVVDSDYSITGTGNKLIAYTAITANRTVTLPPATTSNQRIWITDESGLCSNDRRIIVEPTGGDSVGGDIFTILNFPNGAGLLVSNGAGQWNVISTTAVQFSAGVSIVPSYTDNGNGSVTIGTGVYALYANANGTGRPKGYQIAGGTFTLTDNSTNYIYAKYDTTTGTVSLQQSTTDSVINDLTTIPVFSIYRQGLTLHARDFDTQGLALANKLNRSIQQTQKVRVVEGGVLLGETTSPAVRTVTVSAGTAWVGATEISLQAVNSASNTCYRIYPVAGVYQTTTTVTQYDNQQYSDGTNLQTLTTNNYGVRFIYRSIGNDNDMAIVVGEGNNSLGQAQVAVPPANLPAFLRHMTLVGRIIVKKGDDFATQIDQNTGGTSFASAGVTDHNALNNIQTAQTGVTYGHITDGAQTIAGVKTLSNDLNVNGIIKGAVNKVLSSGATDAGQTFTLTGIDATSRFSNGQTVIYNEDGFALSGSAASFLGYTINNKSTNQSSRTQSGTMARVLQNGTGSIGSVFSTGSTIEGSGTGNIGIVSLFKGLYNPVSLPFSITSFYGLDLTHMPNTAGGGVTNSRGVFIGDVFGSSIARGVDIGVTSGTGKYNIYSQGTAPNYFAGNVLIGTPTSNGNAFRLTGTAELITTPTTSVGTYDILTRNTSTGVVEKVSPSGTFIQNQNASAQSANMWITGSGFFENNVLSDIYGGLSGGNTVLTTNTSGSSNLILKTTLLDRLVISGSTGVVQITNLAGTGTRTVVADASGNLSATSIAPTSGTYTPTYTNTANVSSFTHQRAFYSVVDKVVHVTIKLVANVTSAAASTAFEVTTPSTRSSSSFVLVTGSARGDLIAPVMTTGDTTTSAFIEFKPPTGSTATAISVILNMSYEIP